MSEEAYRFWQACLASTASIGAAWMKFASSGVVHDIKTICGPSTGSNDDLSPDILDRIAANRAHYIAATSTAMKEPNEPRGQVINFATAAGRCRSRSNTVRNGSASVQVKK